ncbi:MAG: hypothetical protein ACE367_19645 [Acidimicrobiales bacterium]
MENGSRDQMIWAGAGLVIGAGVGTTLGLIIAGGVGIAFGTTFGAAAGLVAGSAIDAARRRPPPDS